MRRKFLIRLSMMVVLGIAVFAGLWAYTIATKTNGEQKLAALAEEVRPRKGQVFRATLQGQPRVLLLDKCTLYLLDVSDEEIKRKQVLTTDFYFFLDVCGDQTIAVGGEYRSKDGLA